MNTISIPANATTKDILESLKAPRGATHFRYTEAERKPIIEAIKNIDCLAGCTGILEFGKASFEGRGRHAKIKEFVSLQAQTPSTAAPKKDNLRKNKILGFSACAVAKALGAAGLKYQEADLILRTHGIQMPKASLSVQLGFGRRPASWERHGKPAEITPEQIAELRAGILP